jgi:hypothetical protein
LVSELIRRAEEDRCLAHRVQRGASAQQFEIFDVKNIFYIDEGGLVRLRFAGCAVLSRKPGGALSGGGLRRYSGFLGQYSSDSFSCNNSGAKRLFTQLSGMPSPAEKVISPPP